MRSALLRHTKDCEENPANFRKPRKTGVKVA